MNTKYLTIVALFLGLFLISQGQQPELIMQNGHKHAVTAFDFNPKGKLLASSSGDKTIKLTDPSTGLEILSLFGHKEYVYDLRFTQDGKGLLSVGGDRDGDVIMWDTKTWKEKFRKEYKDEVSVLAMHPSEPKAAIFENKKGIHTISTSTGEILSTYEFEDRGDRNVMKLLYSPDGKILAVGTSKKVHLVDANTSTLIRKFETGHESVGIWFSLDSKTFHTAGTAMEWQKWDVATGNIMGSMLTEKQVKWGGRNIRISLDEYDHVAVTNDRSLFAKSADEYIVIFDLETGKPTNICFDPGIKGVTDDGDVTALKFSPDNKILISGHGDDDLRSDGSYTRFWDVRSGRMIRERFGSDFSLNSVILSPNNKSLAINSKDRYEPIQIIPISEAGQSLTLDEDSGRPLNIRWSPDSKVLYWGEIGTYLQDLNTGDVKELQNTLYHSYNRKLFLDEEFMVLAPDFSTISVKTAIHEFPSGKYLCDFKPRGNRELARYIDPNSKYFIVLSETFADRSNMVYVDVYDLKTCQLQWGSTYTDKKADDDWSKIVVSADGSTMASGASKLFVWDLNTKMLRKELPGNTKEKFEKVRTLALSPDGKILASGGIDKDILIWDTFTGKKIATFVGHDDQITSLQFTKKGNMLVSSSLDTKVIFWNVATHKPEATLIAMAGGEYVMSTPDNYYMASRDALNRVAFRVGPKVYPFEQFDLKYNRPDIVMERLGVASKYLIKMYGLAYKKRLKKFGFTEAMLGNDFHVPEIEIENKFELPAASTSGSVSFKVKAWDDLYSLNRINLYVNDVPVYGKEGINLKNANTKKWENEIKVDLGEGLNRIQISALNSKGVESARETFLITSEAAVSKPDLYLISIGVSEFKDSERNLKYAAKDANDLADMFTKSAQYGSVKVKRLLNQDATVSNIKAAAMNLQSSKPDDMVVIYISSHGLLDDDMNYYLATHDVDFFDPVAKGLHYDEIDKMIDGVPARNRLILIDACHSGEIDKDDSELETVKNEEGDVKIQKKSGNRIIKPKAGLKNSFAYMQNLFADVSKGSGATIISAAGGYEFALESGDWNNGVFTYSLLNGMKSGEADLNKDKVIQISELKEYVVGKVTELTNGLQVPTTRKENLINDFRIW